MAGEATAGEAIPVVGDIRRGVLMRRTLARAVPGMAAAGMMAANGMGAIGMVAAGAGMVSAGAGRIMTMPTTTATTATTLGAAGIAVRTDTDTAVTRPTATSQARNCHVTGGHVSVPPVKRRHLVEIPTVVSAYQRSSV